MIEHAPNSQKAAQTRGSAPRKTLLSLSLRRVHRGDVEVTSVAGKASWRDVGRGISGRWSREGKDYKERKKEKIGMEIGKALEGSRIRL